MNILDKSALTVITCYKAGISPHKGFKCAYGVTHGISCSTVVENLIKEHGVMDARPFVKQQFEDCTKEYLRLKAEGITTTEVTRSNNTTTNKCDTCDIHACSTPLWFPSRGKSSGNSCDVFDCDIGGCDL